MSSFSMLNSGGDELLSVEEDVDEEDEEEELDEQVKSLLKLASFFCWLNEIAKFLGLQSGEQLSSCFVIDTLGVSFEPALDEEDEDEFDDEQEELVEISLGVDMPFKSFEVEVLALIKWHKLDWIELDCRFIGMGSLTGSILNLLLSVLSDVAANMSFRPFSASLFEDIAILMSRMFFVSEYFTKVVKFLLKSE